MTTIFPPSGDQDQERLAAVSAEDRNRMWFSLEFYGVVLSRRPAQLEALEAAANIYTALGFYTDGLQLDRRLAALKPDDPGILYNLACSLALTGSREEALAQLARAVASGYVDRNHMENDRDLQSLHGDPRFVEILAGMRDVG